MYSTFAQLLPVIHAGDYGGLSNRLPEQLDDELQKNLLIEIAKRDDPALFDAVRPKLQGKWLKCILCLCNINGGNNLLMRVIETSDRTQLIKASRRETICKMAIIVKSAKITREDLPAIIECDNGRMFTEVVGCIVNDDVLLLILQRGAMDILRSLIPEARKKLSRPRVLHAAVELAQRAHWRNIREIEHLMARLVRNSKQLFIGYCELLAKLYTDASRRDSITWCVFTVLDWFRFPQDTLRELYVHTLQLDCPALYDRMFGGPMPIETVHTLLQYCIDKDYSGAFLDILHRPWAGDTVSDVISGIINGITSSDLLVNKIADYAVAKNKPMYIDIIAFQFPKWKPDYRDLVQKAILGSPTVATIDAVCQMYAGEKGAFDYDYALLESVAGNKDVFSMIRKYYKLSDAEIARVAVCSGRSKLLENTVASGDCDIDELHHMLLVFEPIIGRDRVLECETILACATDVFTVLKWIAARPDKYDAAALSALFTAMSAGKK